MNLQDFINKWSGGAASYDGIKANVGQCEQLVCVYWRDVLGFSAPMIPAAKDLWTNPTVLANFNQIPVGQEQPGDVAVFGASSAIGSPEFGHTDIVVKPGFQGFDSNWGGVKDANGYPAAHLVQHSYVDVLGFLRKKETIVKPTEQQIKDAFLEFNGTPTQQQVDYYLARESGVLYRDLLGAARPSVQEVKDAFQSVLKVAPSAAQLAYYPNRAKGILYQDLANAKPVSSSDAKLQQIKTIIEQ